MHVLNMFGRVARVCIQVTCIPDPQAKVVSGAALQQPVAAGTDAAAAEAADRRRIMYEVQWQAISAAAAGLPGLGASPHQSQAVLASRNRTGDIVAQV